MIEKQICQQRSERGRYGAYFLRAGYKLPPLIFTEEESLALTLSLLQARARGLAQTSPAFEGALAKIERVLSIATRQRIQAVEQTLAFEDARSSRTSESDCYNAEYSSSEWETDPAALSLIAGRGNGARI